MKANSLKFILGLLFFLFQICSFGQIDNFLIKQLTVDNGLSQTLVECAIQDYRGFIWIGTQDGLNRYDGYVIKQYQTSPNTNNNSITHNSITWLFEDSKKRLWIGTASGISLYNNRKDNFKQYYKFFNDGQIDGVYSIIEDRNGTVWIGTEKGVVGKYNEKEDGFENMASIKAFILSLSCLDKNYLWVGTSTGLKIFSLQNNSFDSTEFYQNIPKPITNAFINNVFDENHEFYWFASFKKGIYCYDVKNKLFIQYPIDEKSGKLNAMGRIYSIYKDKSNQYWAATEGGLYVLNSKRKVFVSYKNENLSTNELLDLNFRFISQENTGTLLLGSNKGLVFLKPNYLRFKPIRFNLPNVDITDLNMIWGFVKTSESVYWISSSAGLIKYNSLNNTYKLLKIKPVNSEVLNNSNIFVMNYCNNYLWLGTWVYGLVRFDPANETFYSYSNQQNDNNSLNSNSVFSICQDKPGYFWIGTDKGISYFDEKKQKFFNNLSNESDNLQISNCLIYSMYKDKNQVLWIGTNRGMFVMNTLTNKLSKLSCSSEYTQLLNTCIIYNVVGDEKGNIWIGAIDGLFQLNPETNKLTYINNKYSLSTQIIYSILPDLKQNIWLSSNKGLIKLEESTNTAKSYDINDGLQSNEFNSGACLLTKNGELFFGGINGFNKFYPDSITIDSILPALIITDFKIMNQSVPVGESKEGRKILSESITFTSELELEYRENFISFDFSLMSFLSPEKNRYRYKLVGFDTAWIDNGNRNFVNYTNLSHGEYTFQVIAANHDGIWSKKATSIKIIINPPFWKTRSFIFFSIVMLIISIVFFMRYRERNLYQNNRELENKVKERTSEISSKEAELRNSKEFTDSIISNAKDGIIVFNFDGDLLRTNQAFEKMIGYSQEELRTFALSNIFSKNSTNMNFVMLQKISAFQKFYAETELIRKDLSSLSISISASPLTSDNQNPISGMAIISDISIRKKNEKELEKYRNHLEQLVKDRTFDLEKAKEKAELADRLKSAFLANMSHEIRTPMNAIIGFSELLKEEDLSNEDRMDFINNITVAGESLLNLIDDIIDIAKIEADQLKISLSDCNINHLLNELHITFTQVKENYHKGHLNLLLNIPEHDHDLIINSDSYRLKQIFTNLIGNAIKFTDNGTVEFGYSKEFISVNNMVMFYVKDSGIGIPDKEKDTIFERFVKLDENRTKLYRGTGLGLAISKKLVELLGGKIWVDSKEKVGSTFYINLPYHVVNKNDVIDKEKEPIGVLNWESKTILVAEDEEMNFLLVKKILEKTRIQIFWAQNGLEAIEIFEQQPNIDLILMDIRMPVMDGYEAAKRIRLINPNVPIIAQTAFAMQGDRELSIASGCSDYIKKPFYPNDLLLMMSNYIS